MFFIRLGLNYLTTDRSLPELSLLGLFNYTPIDLLVYTSPVDCEDVKLSYFRTLSCNAIITLSRSII